MSLTLSNIGTAIGSIVRVGSSSPVILGDLVLTGVEVPDHLQVGGRQMMVIHRLPGGQRVIDALGNDPSRLELRGRFIGVGAQERAQSVERMRDAGESILFSAAGFSIDVLIAEFSYCYEDKGALCTYSMTLEAINSSVESAEKSVGQLFDSNIESAISSLSSAVSGPIHDAFNEVSQMETVAAQIMPVASIMGKGGSLSKVMNAMSTVRSITQQSANWIEAPSALQRIGEQLGVAGGGITSILQDNGNYLDSTSIDSATDLGFASVRSGLESIGVDTLSSINQAKNLSNQV